jgi:hypothetical protein
MTDRSANGDPCALMVCELRTLILCSAPIDALDTPSLGATMRTRRALSLAVIGMALAAFFYRESDRFSSEANTVENDVYRLTGMLAARARNEPNHTELEQFRREVQARYEPLKTYEIQGHDLSSRLLDRAFELRRAARGKLYWSQAAASLGILGAMVVWFRRRAAKPGGEKPATED